MRIRRPKGLNVCSGCGGPRDRGNERTCKKCHSENMRAYRSGGSVKRKVRPYNIRKRVLPPVPCCFKDEPCEEHRKKPPLRKARVTDAEIDALAEEILSR